MIEALQDAILKKDPDKVVAILSDWDEEQRKAAIEPFNILMLALGFDRKVIQPCSLSLDDSEVQAKRKRDGIQQMFRWRKDLDKKLIIDYEMSNIAWLARYGLETLGGCIRFLTVPDHEARAAQIMADRRPPWWDEWYAASTKKGKDYIGFPPDYWSLLYERQLLTSDDFPAVIDEFTTGLTSAMELAPEATKRVLQDIPACRELVYSIPDREYQLLDAKPWVPVIEYLREENLLEYSRLLKSLIKALHGAFNQTERNGCLILMKAAKASPDMLAEFQTEWTGFLSDSQAVVVGFAVEQLKKLEKSALLNAHEAVTALPGVFSHKPKKHAKTALDLLACIATDPALRRQAMESTALALMHANKEIQIAAIEILEQHLQANDDAAINSIQLHLETISPTLKEKAAALVEFESNSSSTASTETSVMPSTTESVDLSELETQATLLPESVRKLLRVDEAIAAAQAGSTDLTCRWTQQDVPVLATATPLTPIETVEELIEVTSSAVERLEDPDTAERIIEGIMRLCEQRPKSFKSMTDSLAKRAYESIENRPQRGITGGYYGTAFSLLIGVWLERQSDDYDFITLAMPLQRFLNELSQRVQKKTAYELISSATHSGGWIDPNIWVERLAEAERNQIELLTSDLERSCLRLAPDRRNAALDAAQQLNPPYQALAQIALGGDAAIDPALPPPVWIAALRARDAWSDVSLMLSPEERSVITEEIACLPDVVFPCDYQWATQERVANSTMQQDVIRAWPTQEEEQRETTRNKDLLKQIMESLTEGENVIEAMKNITLEDENDVTNVRFLSAELHQLRVAYAPSFLYPYLSSQWPMKLDWYWCLATKALARRVESGSSVEEPYDQFLVPLFEQDRPITIMAARALWIATVSKDGSAHSMAIEVWIALAESDRFDLEILMQALADVMEGGWVKHNRIGEVLAEVASVSPLHNWAIACLLEAILTTLETLPRNVSVLLEPLDESSEQLGRAISPELKKRLETIKSGKAKPLAKSLMNRTDNMTSARQTAIKAALNARIARAQRVAVSSH